VALRPRLSPGLPLSFVITNQRRQSQLRVNRGELWALGQIRHGSDVVEYRVEQHRAKLEARLQKMIAVAAANTSE
jgi:hypothetical protein